MTRSARLALPDSDFLVRPAAPEDAEALAALLRAFAAEEGKNPREPLEAARVAEWLTPPEPRFAALIGWRGAAAEGYLVHYPAFSLFKPGPVLLVENLYLAPEARGSGLARLLMAEAAREAGRRGCSRLELNVGTNNRRGRRFYEKLGLSAPGETVYRVEDEALRRLAEG